MNILLLGASGMIGSRILAEASSRGHTITATARTPEKITAQPGVTAQALELADKPALAAQAAKADVVVSAISPRNSGDAMADALNIADTLIETLGGTRLVLVGGAGSLNLPDGSPVADVVPEPYTAEAKAMRAAFEKIAASSLDFTVHAPAGVIQPGERTGTFRIGGQTILNDADGNSAISAEDYAVALLNEVENPQHKGTIFHAAY